MSRVVVMTGSSSGIGYETYFFWEGTICNGKERSHVNDL